MCAHIAWQRGSWERGGGEGIGQVGVEGYDVVISSVYLLFNVVAMVTQIIFPYRSRNSGK